MTNGTRRDFDKAAAGWDDNPRRRQLAAAVSAAISADVPLQPGMQALEYGCGTGLCGLQLAGEIGHLTAVDSSAGMLAELAKKVASLGLGNVTPRVVAPEDRELTAESYDLVFSCMVLHHVVDIRTLLQDIATALKPGGFVALADLECEDGTFHDDPTGVAHHGFVPDDLIAILQQAGFIDLSARTVHTIRKERDDSAKLYPIFLVVGRKG